MNKTYKIQLPQNKEAQNIRTNIKDGTIEVEVELNEKWEPKDGEILTHSLGKPIVIYHSDDDGEIITYAGLGASGNITTYVAGGWGDTREFRPATDSEKQLLFGALAKEGKMWDAEKKQVVDMPRWRANKNEHYFHIYWTPAPRVSRATDCCLDCDYRRYNMGNYFKTKEAAERVAEQIREIFKNSKAE